MRHHIDNIFNEMIEDVKYVKIYSAFSTVVDTKSVNNIAKK